MRNGLHTANTLSRGRALCAAVLLLTAATACTGRHMKTHYEKAWVKVVKVKPVEGDKLLLSLYAPSESLFYPSGVNYESADGVLRVAIDRCSIHETCDTMVQDKRELSPADPFEVRIPYHGERVVLVHTDGEQAIYP